MKYILELILILSSSVAFAAYDYNNIKEDWSAPLNVSESHKLLYYGGATTGFLVLFRDQIVEPFQEHMSENEPMGENLAHFGDLMGQVIPNVLYAGGMYWHYKAHDDGKSFNRSMLMIRATAYSGMTTMILKRAINQRRPDKGDRLSFPSGHTTTAFAFASVVGMEHDRVFGIAAYTLAAIVGLSRINDNAHYLHDVTAGATIGAVYGIALWHQDQKKRESKQSHFSILPTSDGLFAHYQTNF